MFKPLPRIIISGLRGGSGKTILSLSLCFALKNKGYKVTAFKKGPDYIDAGWLAQASGGPCYNLDLFMMEPKQITDSFLSHSKKNTDIAVIEGNRGLYDGMDHEGTYSTAELAKLLKTPVLIIIDCTKATNTIAAQILGCQKMDPDVPIRGVVLNNVATKRQDALIRKAIEIHCGLPVVGVIPRLNHNPFPERHMGLTPFQEHKEISNSISAMNVLGMEYLDLDAIWKIASEAEPLAGQSEVKHEESKIKDSSIRIGIIKDSAFQFYYPENIEELEKRGAKIMELSVLKDNSLPELDALYIGGGFPETNAIALSENMGFIDSLRSYIENGLPVYAECGGLMYLGKSLVLDNKTYPMAGIFPLVFSLEKRPQAHGYTVIEVSEDNPFFKKGCILKGHEFHYSKATDIGNKKPDMCFNVKRGKGITENMDGIFYKNVLATYTHLHAIGSPEWADGIINCAIKYKDQN